MARRLNFQGGLAGLADVTKQLLLSQSQIYENEELRRIRQEKEAARRAYEAARSPENLYRWRKLERDEIAAAKKAERDAKRQELRQAAEAAGRGVPAGIEDPEAIKLYLGLTKPPKPKTAAELEKYAQETLKFDLTMSAERLKILEKQLNLSSDPETRAAQLETLAQSPNQKEQQLYLQYREELNKRSAFLSDPNVLNKYRQRALEASGRPAHEIMQEVEQEAAHGAQPDTSEPSEDLLERLMQGLEDFDEE